MERLREHIDALVYRHAARMREQAARGLQGDALHRAALECDPYVRLYPQRNGAVEGGAVGVHGGNPGPAAVQMGDVNGQQYLAAIEQVCSFAPPVKLVGAMVAVAPAGAASAHGQSCGAFIGCSHG